MMQKSGQITTFSVALVFFIRVGFLAIVACYSQISVSGNSNNRSSTHEGPKIYKAMNFDLVFPQTFNSSENVIATTRRNSVTGITNPTSHQPPPMTSVIFVTPAVEQEEGGGATTLRYDVAASFVRKSQGAAPGDAMSANHRGAAAEHEEEEDARDKHMLKQEGVASDSPQSQLSQQHVYASSGRAVAERPRFPFGQLITQPPAAAHATAPFYGGRRRLHSSAGQLVYPSGYRKSYPLQRNPSKAGQSVDRFSPSEGVVTHQLKNQKHYANHHHHHHSSPSDAFKSSASSNHASSYVPPKELYSFPPNIDAKYPSPAEDPQALIPTNSISSYKPPPSGPLTNSGYNYAGPINPSYTSPPPPTSATEKPQQTNSVAMDAAAADYQAGDADDAMSIGVLPASAMEVGDGSPDMVDDMTPGGNDMSDDMLQQQPERHPALTGYDSGKEYPTPPPGWLEAHPEEQNAELTNDHAHADETPPLHHHYHHNNAEMPSLPFYRHPYPEIIHDDHFDYHHHHLHHPPEENVVKSTTEAAPPPEPRVKKYSYFYIGRKLWYIPLYFTVWFSFYVLWLILKSIARHKVNLPNHYVSRRSLPIDEWPHKSRQEILNKLTVNVMKAIDSLQRNNQ